MTNEREPDQPPMSSEAVLGFLNLASEDAAAEIKREVARGEEMDDALDQHGHRGLALVIVMAFVVLAVAVGWIVATRGDDTPSVAPVGTAGSPAAAAPTDDTVFRAPVEVLGSWVCTDGDFGYEFNDDGTYVFTSLDSRTEGRYRVSGDGSSGTIDLLDASDPSGLTATLIIPYEMDGSSMWLTMVGDEREMVRGTMPDPGSTAAPVVTFDASQATSLNGRIEALVRPEESGYTTPVSLTLVVDRVEGVLTIDAVSGTVSGDLRAHYSCPPEYCDLAGESGEATLLVSVTSAGPSDYMQDTWAFGGDADVEVRMDAVTPYADQLLGWRWYTEQAARYEVGLERTWAVFDLDLRLENGDKIATLQVIGPVS